MANYMRSNAWIRFFRRIRGASIFATVLFGLFFLLLPRVLESTLRRLDTYFPGGSDAFIYILFGCVLMIILAYFAFSFRQYRSELRPEQLPILEDPPSAEILSVVPVSDEQTLRQVTRDVVQVVFPGAAPPLKEVVAGLARNKHATLALYSEGVGPVGFASFWPLKEEAAREMLAGRKGEKKLKRDDILPQEENNSAEYAYVPGIAVLDAGSPEGKHRAHALLYAFRDFILQNYYSPDGVFDPDRTITVFAFIYSTAGQRAAKLLKLSLHGHVNDGGEIFPIYSRRISGKEMKELFSHARTTQES